MASLLRLGFLLLPFAIAAPSSTPRNLGPKIQLPYATVVGSTLLGVDTFNGIPYAEPPVGQLRLKPPQPITSSSLGVLELPAVPKACPQIFVQVNSKFLPADVLGLLLDSPLEQKITDAGEDCLTINVQRPSTATADSKLPVLFYMFGGGFDFGSTQTYIGTDIVQNSVLKGKDIIYVAVNYRIGGFGFLAGKEILQDGSANLGLLDQRLGLQWVADNIAAFGGDPDKVTIWGESAGSFSVFNQMALNGGDHTYKGNNLFRAAIMDSGSTVPTDPVDGKKGQDVYDQVVKAAGCSGNSDTLSCLRSVDYETFFKATTSVPAISGYTSLDLSYLPRPDGTLLTDSPDVLAKTGQFAPVPFIIGDQEDEGTLFSLVQENITTTDELVDYFNTLYFPDASRDTVTQLVNLYPDDPAAGSPFGTGSLNNVYPQYKRLAAILGDLVFTLSRRYFLNFAANAHPTVPTWSYLASYGYGTPILGTFHASDILPAFGYIQDFASASIQDYYISFVNDLNPNGALGSGAQVEWPQWGQGKGLLNFRVASNVVITDDFRQAAGEFIGNTTDVFRV